MIAALLPAFFAAAEATPPAAAGMGTAEALTWAVVLLGLAVLLALAEFLVVSWGMLLIGAAVSAAAAVALAFRASEVAGWIFLILTPGLGVAVTAVGLKLLRRSRATVVAAELTSDAGYHQLADQHGIAPGSLGELVSRAYPTGRARFAGRNGPVVLDVAVRGGVLDQGARVVVLAIEGPTIFVGSAPAVPSTLIDTSHTGASAP